jgi:predicted NUDIX family NTP pyrophosphohydrolase
VAKLDHYGKLVWNTFLGSAADDHANGIALDENGNIYIAGESHAAWGAPLGPYTGGQDGFLAKLNSSGVLQWNRFMGSPEDDSAIEIAADSYGNIFVAGNSDGTWGTPQTPYAGGTDVFFAWCYTTGDIGPMTFMGSPGQDEVGGLTFNNYGLYVTGTSDGTWGTPVEPYTGGTDAFLAKFTDGPYLSGNTFMGSPGNDHANGIVIAESGNIIVAGDSHSGWGPSADSYAGGTDAFVVTFDSDLALLRNTFLGSAGDDHANGIVKTLIGESEQFIVAGDSSAV